MKKKNIFFLSGLSESGKSQAGIWATQNGIFRLKIIYFERLVANKNNINTTYKNKNWIDEIYKNENKGIKQFIDVVYDFMVSNKCDSISLESLYRANLAKSFINDHRFNTEIIYIEAPIDKRATREYYKLKKSDNEVDFDNIFKQTTAKDNLKISNGVIDVKNIATQIINNDGTLKKFKKEILNIYRKSDNSNA